MQVKKVIIGLVVLGIVGVGSYYAFLNKNSTQVTPPVPATSGVSQQAPVPATPNTPSTVQTATVSISNFAFVPSTLTIKKGTKVTWTNNDSAPHTVVSDSGNLLNSQTLSTGQSFSATFTEGGTISYHCSVHPGMTGRVVIQN